MQLKILQYRLKVSNYIISINLEITNLKKGTFSNNWRQPITKKQGKVATIGDNQLIKNIGLNQQLIFKPHIYIQI